MCFKPNFKILLKFSYSRSILWLKKRSASAQQNNRMNVLGIRSSGHILLLLQDTVVNDVIVQVDIRRQQGGTDSSGWSALPGQVRLMSLKSVFISWNNN